MRAGFAAAAFLLAFPLTAAAVVPPPEVRYLCADGRSIALVYSGQSTAELKIAGASYTLSIAPSADGARYTGRGWQWWGKGMAGGTLAKLAPGEAIAKDPGTACHTPQ